MGYTGGRYCNKSTVFHSLGNDLVKMQLKYRVISVQETLDTAGWSSCTRLSGVSVTWTLLTAAVCRSRSGDMRSISRLILKRHQTISIAMLAKLALLSVVSVCACVSLCVCRCKIFKKNYSAEIDVGLTSQLSWLAAWRNG